MGSAKPPRDEQSSHHPGRLWWLPLVLLASLLYLPTVRLPLWQDDWIMLAALRRDGPFNVVFPADPVLFWRPLGHALHWAFLGRLFGFQPVWMHVLNLALWAGIVAAVTRFLAACKDFPQQGPLNTFNPGLIAMLYGLHSAFLLPVGWASGAQELWLLLNAALSFWAWTRFLQTQHPAAAAGALATLQLALWSKEPAVLIPILWTCLAAYSATWNRRAALVASAGAGLVLLHLLARSQFVVAPPADSPYALHVGTNTLRNAAALLAFSFNVSREAVRLLLEHRSPLAVVSILSSMAGTLAALLLLFPALRLRQIFFAAAWWIVAIAPYLLLRWNCYPYYALLALMGPSAALALAERPLPRARMLLATLLFASASLISHLTDYLAPFPAPFARAPFAERFHRQYAHQTEVPPDGLLLLDVRGKGGAFGTEGGPPAIAMRFNLPEEQVRYLEEGEVPPPATWVLQFEGREWKLVKAADWRP